LTTQKPAFGSDLSDGGARLADELRTTHHAATAGLVAQGVAISARFELRPRLPTDLPIPSICPAWSPRPGALSCPGRVGHLPVFLTASFASARPAGDRRDQAELTITLDPDLHAPSGMSTNPDDALITFLENL
jgi:hypothetical protein